MKAVLVIDMPKTCYDCKFIVGGDWFKYRCELVDEEFEFINGKRKVFCPLKPLPKRYIKIAQIENGIVKNNEEIQFMRGWNACIDKILGEENE